MKIVLWLLLFTFYSKIDKSHSDDDNAKCRGISTDQMKTFTYKSDKWGEQTKVKISEPLQEKEAGKKAKVYIGFTDQNGNSPHKNKCVVIKIYDERNKQHYDNNIRFFNLLNENGRMNGHIVSLIDHGRFDEKFFTSSKENYYLTILELGERDLEEEIKEIKANRISQEEFKGMVKDTMRTLVEFHQVGIHLDFKPQNVIVVESIEKVKSFKLIDFDASIVYLDEHKKGKGTKKSLHYTERFAAPELFQALSSNDPLFVEVTPKMDIWPAGITIFQMVFSKVRQFYSPFHKMVAVELFCCAKLNSDAELLSRIKNLELQEVNASVGSEEWWKTYWQMIGDILTVWHEMPEIVFLSKNMLSIEPEKRMTAKGIIDYLEGKCKPKEYEKNAEKMALFGDVSAKKLREMMEMEGFKSFVEFMKNGIMEERKVRESEKKKKGEKKEKMRSEKDFEKLENMKKKLVKEVEKSVKKLMLKDMNKRKELCDH